MRKFNRNEQKAIKNLLRSNDESSNVLINVFGDFWHKNKAVYESNGQAIVKCYCNDTDIDKNKLLSIKMEIIAIAKLVEYLKNDRQIYLFTNVDMSPKTTPVFLHDGLQSIALPIPKDIAEILDLCLCSNFYVTQDLIDVACNNFISYEEQILILSKKQLRVSIIVLVVTVILGILTGIINLMQC